MSMNENIDSWKTVSMETVEENYNIAIEYYKQRQAAFFNFYKNKYNLDLETVLKDIEEFLMGVWPQFCTEVINTSSLEERQELIKDFLNTYDIDGSIPTLAALKNPQAALGNIFEDVFKSAAEDAIKGTASEAARNLIAQVTGAIKSSAANVSGVRSIRNDVMLYLDSMNLISGDEYENSRARLTTQKDELNLELQTDILLGEDVDLDSLKDASQLINTLWDYIDPNSPFAGAGGFNLKYWSLRNIGSGKRFSDSAPYAEHLNKLLASANKGKGVLTYLYANLYNVYFLSQRLINLISPDAVGFVDGDEISLVSDILSAYHFRFALTHEDQPGWHRYAVKNATINMYKAGNVLERRMAGKTKKSKTPIKITVKNNTH